ncbi:MAG: bglX, partial [Actinomycetia bacterium]|nr:bglX [Actinomycetes bacterium]
MKSFPGARNRWTCRIVATAAVALALPLAALADPSSGAAVQAAGGTARTTADTASCPWLNQSLPVQQRVSMLTAQMTLADKITMVTGAGTSEPYVFYISAIPSLCVPAIGEEDGPLGVGDGLAGVTQ